MDDGLKRHEPHADGQGGHAALTEDEKNWAMFCHVAVFAGCLFPLGNIIGPLVVWLMKKEVYPFVDHHGRQAVNFQITFLVAMLASLLLSFVLVGVFMLIGFSIVALVVTIRAIVAASRGQYYRYPFCIRFIS